MKRTVEFNYDLGNKVLIRAIGMYGSIDSLSQDICGQQVRVVYWNNGARCQVWMYEWEVEAIPEGK